MRCARCAASLAIAQQAPWPTGEYAITANRMRAGTAAAAPIRCRARPGDRAPDWPRSARRRASASSSSHVGGVEIGDAPAHDLAVATQPLERVDRFGERNAAAPVQQIEIEAIGARAAAGCARRRRSRCCAPALCGYTLLTTKTSSRRPAIARADDLLGAAVAVHLGRVDERHAEVEPARSAATSLRAARRALRPCATCRGRAPARSCRRRGDTTGIGALRAVIGEDTRPRA